MTHKRHAEVRDADRLPEGARDSPLGTPAGADVHRLQRRAIGKAVGAVLSRAPTEVRNVELRTLPERPKMRPAAERTTSPNMPLAQEIDEADKLSDDELKGLRARVAIEVAAAGNDVDTASRQAADAKRAGRADAEAAASRVWSLQSTHAKLLLKLEAIEYVANWRRLPPMKVDRFRYQDTRRELANRRANFRLAIEERVRKTGSLDDALDGMPADAEEVQAIRKEAAEFASRFKSQAWDNCQRMLVTSQDVMFGVLKSYGVPATLVERAVRRMHDEKLSARAAAQWVVDEILKEAPEELDKTVNAKDPEDKRARLVGAVRRLEPLQQKVKDLAAAASGLNTRPGVQSSVDAMNKAIRELPVAQRELAAEWMEVEREHQVLAAYRGDKRDLEKLDLSTLDVSAKQTDQLVKEVLVRVLPKLKDNGEALWMLRQTPPRLKPMAMPPVVALTSAAMFVPEGSIRAGVVRDLMDQEKSSRSGWLLTVATVALAIVTLLPTGGMSAAILVPVGIASAGLAAYSALKIYEKYEKQKLLVNTDLDLSRALSNEQPSLRGFAMTLVTAGLEGFALFRLWRKGVELRKLAIERQRMTEAMDEFKALMNEQRRQADTERFLDEVLRGTPADRSAARGGGQPPTTEPPKTSARDVPDKKPATPHEPPKPVPPRAPAGIKKTTSENAVDLGYRDAAHVRAVVTDRLSRLKTGMDRANLPREYLELLEILKAGSSLSEKEILKHIDAVMGALRNPKLYGDVMADAYEIARANGLTIEEGLMHLARKEGLKIKAVPPQAGLLQGDAFFDDFVTQPVSIHDLPFKFAPNAPLSKGYHGSVMHIVQDLVINRANLGRTSYAFRKTLGAADRRITVTNLAGDQEIVRVGDWVWRNTYDLFVRGHLPMPEMGGAVLKQFLKVR